MGTTSAIVNISSSTTDRLDIPLFGGHGAPMQAALAQAREDARTPAGTTLLAACHEALHTELRSLPPSDLARIGIDLPTFSGLQTLLTVTHAEEKERSPVLAGVRLFLVQVLRYLAFVLESDESTSPVADALERWKEVLGFSAGMLSACVVAASPDLGSLIANAVQGFRVALWLGVRMGLWRADTLSLSDVEDTEEKEKEEEGSWSVVLHGVLPDEAQALTDAFEGVCIAALTPLGITISGHPRALATFTSFLPPDVRKTALEINTLYHAPVLANVLAEVKVDLARRRVRFPSLEELRVPVRCTVSGEVLRSTSSTTDEERGSGSLIDRVLGMILTQPVRWDIVTHNLLVDVGARKVRLLNFGPGTSVARMTARALGACAVVVDVSSSSASTSASGRVDSLRLDANAPHAPGHVPAPCYEPIAIVGMAANVPGAPNVERLWELLQNGVNTVREIPAHRFKVEDYTTAISGNRNGTGDATRTNNVAGYENRDESGTGRNAWSNGEKNPKRQMKAHTGNFLADSDAEGFDHAFFKISPREARSMDPQQRVLLHAAHAALEDAGYVPRATPSSDPARFGVYIGAATSDYVQNLREEIDVYYSTGTLRAFLSGRISYAMQLGGPSVVVDTACSSSGVALYQGVRALMNGDCDAALVGGVNIVSSPDMFLGLDRGHFLSPTGQCKAFDAAADGYARSEGCGLFVLKRLRDAEADGDNILALVRGVEVNQSGAAHSITYPHAPTQAALLRQVLKRSGVPAARVNVVEAHGTGTQAGDPNEVASIRSVLAGKWRGAENPLHITSVKANIGHLEAASGAAGLAKLLLMLKHKRIPRQISLKTLNPRIAPLAEDHTVIPTEEVEWLPAVTGTPRVALVNNFGAAGSNCAVLVEEYVRPPRAETEGVPVVVGLSAKTRDALEELRVRYLEWLPTADAPLADIAYSATARRQLCEWRLAAVATTHAELAEKLRGAKVVQQPMGVPAQAVFVFPGQGGQYLGMGRALYEGCTLVRGCIDECEVVLRGAGFPGVRSVILGQEGEGSGLARLEEVEAFQAAIVALECALAQLWISYGVVPVAVIGHSLGEYAALVTAGVLALKDALLLVVMRARLMVRNCTLDSTGMLAVNLGPDAAMAALRAASDVPDLTIACYNSPTDCVLAGPLDQLKTFTAQTDAKSTLLAVPFGYHSAAMDPLLADLTTAAQHVPLRAPTIPVVSNVLGAVVASGDATVFTPSYFARHCASPVYFERGVGALLAVERVDAWIELGPHPTCLPILRAHPALPKNLLLLPSLRRQHAPATSLACSLAALYISSLAPALRWRAAFAHLPVRCVSLPAYPLAQTKFWVPFVESTPTSAVEGASAARDVIDEYTVLRRWVQYPAADNGCVAVFETPIGDVAAAIVGHRVGGMPLCPASVYIELVLAGVELGARHLRLVHHDSHVVLRRMEFEKPLVYEEDVPRTIVTNIKLLQHEGSFTISSRIAGAADETLHVRGEFKYQSTLRTTTKFVQVLPSITRSIAAVVQPQVGAPPEVFSTRTAYEVIFPRVVEYAEQYHTIQTLSVDASGMEGCATVQLPAGYERGRYVVHPVWMDTLLHITGFVANMHGELADAYICTQVGVVKVFPALVDNDKPYLVYCANAWLPEEGVMLAEAYAVQVADPRRIVAHMKGMHFRRVRLSSLKKSLVLAAGKPLEQAPQNKSPLFARTESHSPLPPRFGDVDAIVLKIVSDACDIPASAVGVNTDLTSIGVDSMMSIEILGGLRGEFPGAELDVRDLSYCTTVSDICRAVKSKVWSSTPVLGVAPAVSEEMASPRSSLGMTRTVSEGTSSPRTLLDETTLQPMLDGVPDVIQILSNVLEVSIDSLGADADLDALGLDSLATIEVLHTLNTEFGLDLPTDFFTTYSTPRAVQAYISSPKSSSFKDDKASPMPLVSSVKPDKAVPLESTPRPANVLPSASLGWIIRALQLDTMPVLIQRPQTSGRLPLYFIHDGSGLVNYYDRLSFLDRAIWGIHNPRFTSGRPWEALVDMAAAYVEYILSTTSGPLLLGGWSFGGVAAYEVALQLTSRGIQVKGVLLIDSPSPINHTPLSDALIDTVLDRDGGRSELSSLVKAQFALNVRMLGEYIPHATASLCPPLVLLRSSVGFRPAGIPVGDVPAWLADRSDPQTCVAGWQRLAHCAVKVLDIPGDHFQAFHPSNITELSLRIADACEYLERL